MATSMMKQYKDLIAPLARKFAEDELVAQKQIYKQDAEFYAGEGITLSSHLRVEGIEGIEIFLEEHDLLGYITKAAQKEYRALLKAEKMAKDILSIDEKTGSS